MLSGGEESDSGDNELLSDGDGESGDSDAAAAFVFDGPSLRERRRAREAAAAEEAAAQEADARPPKRRRRARRGNDAAEDKLGRRRMDPSKSPWWALLNSKRAKERPHSWEGKEFRKLFRLPRELFDDLYDLAAASPTFRPKDDAARRGGLPRHPLKLKICAALVMLAKGCEPSEVRNDACMDAETLRVFFLKFTAWMASDEVYPHWVCFPDSEAMRKHRDVYARLGYPGGCCSADGVHWAWNRCPFAQKPAFTGKEDYPTVAFNVTVLHTKWVAHVGDWQPGGRNDKTQARFDSHFSALRDDVGCAAGGA